MNQWNTHSALTKLISPRREATQGGNLKSRCVGWPIEVIEKVERYMERDPWCFQQYARRGKQEIASMRRRSLDGRFATEAKTPDGKAKTELISESSASRAGILAAFLGISERQAYYLIKVYRASRYIFLVFMMGEISMMSARAIAASPVLTHLVETGKIRPSEIGDLGVEDMNAILAGYTPKRFRKLKGSPL